MNDDIATSLEATRAELTRIIAAANPLNQADQDEVTSLAQRREQVVAALGRIAQTTLAGTVPNPANVVAQINALTAKLHVLGATITDVQKALGVAAQIIGVATQILGVVE